MEQAQIAAVAHAALERDRLAIDAYYAILRSGRGEWIELMHYAPLASQHHMSAYSQLKFGVLGAPYAYVPLSLQQPVIIEAMLGRQRNCERRDWCMRISHSLEVQRKCTCRTAECLCRADKAAATDTASVTTELRAGAQHDEINLGAQMEQIQSAETKQGASLQNDFAAPVLSKTTSAPAQLAQPSPQALPTLGATVSPAVPALHDAGVSVPGTSHGAAVRTSVSHPINVSPIIPGYAMSSISGCIVDALPPALAALTKQMDTRETRMYMVNGIPTARSEVVRQIEALIADPTAHLLGQLGGEQPIRLPCVIDLDRIIDEAGTRADDCHTPSAQIGNLLLSSCPGKKVRLDGPLHGRSTVCRNLRADLERFRDMGVRAIVCCLDDEELNLLGSPYATYEREIEELGFDLLRLPIAEGFAPTDPARFDSIISAIVFNYSMRGASVLVHCRGGVGRAGLVACAWIFKMGLVWRAPHSDAAPSTRRSAQVMDIVLRLIDVVRKRRSPKAIETAEQARFLGDVCIILTSTSLLFSTKSTRATVSSRVRRPDTQPRAFFLDCIFLTIFHGNS